MPECRYGNKTGAPARERLFLTLSVVQHNNRYEYCAFGTKITLYNEWIYCKINDIGNSE